MIGSAGVFTVSSWNVDNVSIDSSTNPGGITTQGNSALASLTIGSGPPATCGGTGVALIPSGGSIILNWAGPANQPYAMFWSPVLNPSGLLIPCIGSADIGTPPFYNDAVLVFNGLDPVFPGPLFALNGNGTASQSLSIPTLPSAQPLGNLQGLVFQVGGVPCPFILTKAWTISVQ